MLDGCSLEVATGWFYYVSNHNHGNENGTRLEMVVELQCHATRALLDC